MALILNIETATKNCSVSIAEDGNVIASEELNNANYSHAEKLHLFIKNVLEIAQIKMSDLDAVAVSKGPGSYTGLRIGVSAAKGICFSIDKPLIAIETLKSLACKANVRDAFIVPMIDARRMEVYAAVYNSDLSKYREIRAQVIDERAFSDILEGSKVVFLGDGAEKCKSIITDANAVFMDDQHPSAMEMAKLSYIKFKNKEFEDVAYFEPFYLKDFVVTPSKKKI